MSEQIIKVQFKENPDEFRSFINHLELDYYEYGLCSSIRIHDKDISISIISSCIGRKIHNSGYPKLTKTQVNRLNELIKEYAVNVDQDLLFNKNFYNLKITDSDNHDYLKAILINISSKIEDKCIINNYFYKYIESIRFKNNNLDIKFKDEIKSLQLKKEQLPHMKWKYDYYKFQDYSKYLIDLLIREELLKNFNDSIIFKTIISDGILINLLKD